MSKSLHHFGETSALACAACVYFLECGNLDRVAEAVAQQENWTLEKARSFIGDCHYQIVFISDLIQDAAATAERERAARYGGIIAALWTALLELDPTVPDHHTDADPLSFLAQVVRQPAGTAQEEFREWYGGIVDFLEDRLRRPLERQVAAELTRLVGREGEDVGGSSHARD